MESLSVIEIDDLPNLRKLYEVEHPLHVSTTVVIWHFMQRFKKKPEWTKTVKFCSLNDSWKTSGTFVIINTHDDHIVFNTLELPPYHSLRRTLQLINYDKPMIFLWFRDIFRSVVFDVIRVHNLEVTDDIPVTNVFMEDVELNVKVDAPDGFYFDSLNQSHVDQIISNWNVKYAFRPREYISNCIAESPSTGIFDKNTGTVVAWATLHETGTSGNLIVIDKYRRRGFAELLIAVQHAKIKALGYHSTGHILRKNNAVVQLVAGIVSPSIDNHLSIYVQPKQPRNISFKGHL